MKSKKIMLILITAIFLVSIAGVCAADANDTMVASDDANQMVLSSSDVIVEDNLQTGEENNTLTQANDDGTVSAGSDSQILSIGEYTYTDLRNQVSAGGDINLTKGNYTYVDGDGDTIEITTSGVINGNGAVIDMANSGHRAFYVKVAGVTIKNLTIKNANYDAGSGGAIYFSQSGSVINCNFTGNTASGDGGAIRMYSGSVENCNFTGNTASGDGGAIWMYSGSVENCNFTNNQATERYPKGNGGAIYFGSKGNVTNCNFTNNEANGPRSSGGAMYFLNGGDITNCNFAYNTAKYEGGAVFFYNTSTVTNCSFINNELPNCDGSGGAIYLWDGSIKNCKFINNSVSDNEPYIEYSGSGGAIWTFFANIENCNFTNNTATGNCGAICLNNGGYVTNCNFINNKAINGGSYAGAFHISTGNVTNCNFINNTAEFNAGAINAIDLHVIKCNFTNNKVNGDASMAGAISMGAGSIENCNFTNNSAVHDAGAIYAGKSSIENCNFINNNVSTNMSSGGAIYMLFSNVTNCNFTNNTANGDGGAIHADEGSIENCSFTNNRVTDDNSFGGAVYLEKSNVINCSFTNNTACYGGAVYLNGGNVANCSFTNNKVIAHYVYSVSLGGAIYFDNSGTVTTCKFINNKIIGFYPRMEGGAIYGNHQHVIADTCIFKTEFDTNQDVIILPPTLNVDNFTSFYGSGEKITFDLKTNSSIPVTNGNISISLYFKDNNSWVDNYSCLSGEGWIPDLPVGSYYAIFDTEYAEFQPINRTIKIIPDFPYYVNVTTVTTNNKTVNITAKSNLPQNILEGKLLFIFPNNVEINANYTADGIWWAVHTFDDYTDYQVNASYIGLSNVTLNNATISIKANSTVNVTDVVLDYGDSKNVTVTAEGATGITAKINDTNVTVVNNYTIPISGLNAGNYTLTVTTIPDADHAEVTKTVNITVNKAGTEITLTNETLYLKAGDMVSDIANLTPGDAGNLTFQSGNEDIAIAYDGTIYARVKGNVTVTVSFAGTDNYAPAENKTITVYVALKDASVSVENKTLDMGVDEKYEFNPTVNPSFLAVEYSSSNVSVVTVTEYGLVRAVGEGTAIITLTVGNNQTYAINTTNVTVTVSLNDASVSLNNSTLDLFVGDTFTIVATTTPAGLNVTYVQDDSGVYTVDSNGVVTALKTGTGNILVKVGGDGVYAENSTEIPVTVSKIPTEIVANSINAKYNVNKDLVITLKDANGNALSGVKVTVNLNGAKEYTTDKNGQVKVSTSGLVPKVYTATITFDGDNKYIKSTSSVKVTVNKAKPKIVAKKKTYKAKKKTKKFTITLKDNKNKPIKNAKVRLIVKKIKKTSKKKKSKKSKKKYKPNIVKTNKKGKATFKVKRFKKGTYQAKIIYKGNNYYTKVTKTVKIKLK